MKVEDLPEGLRSRIVINPITGCWEWQGAKVSGYGRVWWEGKRQRVHRVVYSLLVGPIPDGLHMDHVKARGCASRACCWPAHLEPVTQRVNSLRGSSPWALNAAKTHCPQDHPYSPENTAYDKNGGRYCRTCRRELKRARRLRDLEAARRYHREYMRAWKTRRRAS